MKRWLAAVAVLGCVPLLLMGTSTRPHNLTYDTSEAYNAPDTLAQRGSLAVAAKTDTLGPIIAHDCKRVFLAIGATATATNADSVDVLIQTSTDRANWVTLQSTTNVGPIGGSGYSLFFYRMLEATTANITASAGGTVIGAPSIAFGKYIRAIITNRNVNGRLTAYSARFSCAR